MRKRTIILTCLLGISVLTACGATKTVENEATESQVVESSIAEETTAEGTETSTEVITEVTEEIAEESTEGGEEPTEESTEGGDEATEESTEIVEGTEGNVEQSMDDPMANIQAILEQTKKELAEKAAQESESQESESKYVFPEGYDSEKYTWRQTTADRNLYFLESDKELIGKEFIGETFEEILQMAEDPTCDFDEANFWNATCFKGLTIKDTGYLVSKGYTVDQLIQMVIDNGVGNVYELNIF